MTVRKPPVCADCDQTIALPDERDKLVCVIELDYFTADRSLICAYFRSRVNACAPGGPLEHS